MLKTLIFLLSFLIPTFAAEEEVPPAYTTTADKSITATTPLADNSATASGQVVVFVPEGVQPESVRVINFNPQHQPALGSGNIVTHSDTEELLPDQHQQSACGECMSEFCTDCKDCTCCCWNCTKACGKELSEIWDCIPGCIKWPAILVGTAVILILIFHPHF